MITQISRKITQILIGLFNLCNLFFLICVIVLLFPSNAHAEIVGDWVITKGHFCTLYINQNVDMKVLNRRINTYNVDFGLSERPRRIGQSPEDEILYKLDLVFLKVQTLLDMRPAKIHLNVKIYKDKAGIDKAYIEIFNVGNKFIAFYVFKLNTLFACEETISAGIVAHEMAHCIMDHHFGAPPPQRIAEMLAHYAELHLKE